MSRGGPGIPRRFHFKSPPLKDFAIQRFKEWSEENRGFYGGFRSWLKENGYGASAMGIYGAAARMAIGYLRKPYWTIDPDADLERVRDHLSQSERTLGTQADYCKGLRKLAEYLRLRCHRPKQEKELPWAYTIGSLSPQLKDDIREYLKHCQRNWKIEQRWERSRDTLYRLGIPLRWMAEHQDLKEVSDLTPQVWFAWLDHRLEAGIQPVSVNSDLSELRHFVSFLRGLGRAVCERFLLVEPLKGGWRAPKDVPVEQLRKLQAVIQAQANSSHAGQRRVGRMDLTWFLLMLHCGLRTCEVRHLKLGDIEWDARRLRIEQSKALKDRYIYLDDAVLGALRSYLAVRGQAEALDGLTGLVNKSLVNVEEQEGKSRYRFLETIRQFAMEKLLESGEAVDARARHLAYFLEYARHAEEHFGTTQRLLWFNRLEVEHDNFRSTLSWALENNPQSALQIVCSLPIF